jgi:autotransporter-associated beta strand protein
MSKNNWNVISEKNHRGLFACILAALISTTAYDAQAATFIWNNTGTQWTSGTSWVGGFQPAFTSSSTTTDDIQFGSLAAGFNNVNLTSNRAAASMTFTAGANAYTVSTDSAKTLSISAALINNSTATQTFNMLLSNANGNNTWTQAAGGSLVFNNGVALGTSATARTVTLAGGGTFNFNSAITQNTSTGSKLTVNNANGAVNLGNFANSIGGATGGGIVITAGQVNFSNAQSLGTGIVELGAATGSAYGSSILNNTSGNAVTLTGLTGVTWSGSITSGNTGIQLGTSASTSANNIDFGTGVVTAASDRSMNIAGTGVTISMGTLTTSGTAGSYIFKIDGAGNTLDLDGWRISGAATPTQAVQHKISGTANVNIGAIENGTGSFANSAVFMSDGTTRLTGNNTYTGTTEFTGSGTTIISGNNSAAVGTVKIAGDTGKTPNVRLDNVNGISSSSSLIGASGTAQVGTLDLRAAGNFSLNSFGTVSTAGNNMIFINSSGSQKTLGFTAANNYITTGSSGGRTLYNNSANLLVDFDGNVEIGGISAAAEATTFAGVGSFNVDGNLLDTGTGLTRALRKQGEGTLTLRGSANSIKGSTLVETGTLDLYGNLTASTSIAVSTSGTSANTGVRTANATVNVRSGASLLNSSTTTVWSRGDLIVNGTAGAVVVESNGLLGGSGTVGAISGSGTVGPGNSPGILTATSVNPTAGTDFKFEFTSLNPTYTSATASGNDLLHLTASSSPFAGGTFASGNIISIYLNSSAITDSLLAGTNTTFSGGFFVDGTYALSSALTPASFAYYTTSASLGTGSAVDYNGSSYYLMDGFATKVTLSDTLVTSAAFATGTVATGTLLTFTAVPEPSTGALLAFGLGGLVVTRLLRRKQS